MADDLTETMDDLKDEIKRLSDSLIRAAGTPISPGAPGLTEEQKLSRGYGALGESAMLAFPYGRAAQYAGRAATSLFPSLRGATGYAKTQQLEHFYSMAEVGTKEAAAELAATRGIGASMTVGGMLGAGTRWGRETAGTAYRTLAGTPSTSPYAAKPGLLGRGWGAIKSLTTAGFMGAIGYGAYEAYRGRGEPGEEEFVEPTGMEAFYPPSTLKGMAMWGGVEEAPQMVSMAAMGAFASGDPDRMAQAFRATTESAERAQKLFDTLSGGTPTMDVAMKDFITGLNEANKLREAQLAAAGFAEPEGVALGVRRKELREDLTVMREDVGIEKAQLAMLTTEYDVNKESIKEWTNVRFAGETVAQESIQNVKYEILEQQKLALAYSSTLDEIEAYRTTRSNLSNEMTLSIATTNLEMVNEAKGSAQKERLTVDLERLRAEKGLHSAQTAVTVGEMQLEMTEYNNVQLKIGELENTLSGLETNYELKFGKMRNDVKFFIQAHEDAATDIPNSVGEVTDKLQPLLDKQGEITDKVEAFKESIKFKGEEIINYRTQIQGLTGDLNALAAAQGAQSMGVPGVSAPSAPAPAYSEEYTTSPYESEWARSGGHFDEFGRRISVVPIYTS